MTVTGLEAQARSGGVRIRVDNRPFVTVAAGDVAELRVAEGRTLAPATARELERRAEVHAARTVALAALSAQALPRWELTRRLLRKGHGREAVEAALAGLDEVGLLDDAEFARHHARTRARRGLGRSRIVADLRRLGVDGRVADSAVREALEAEGVDQGALLAETARKKLRSLAGLDRDKRVRRLRSYLLRRGFPLAEVREVMRRLGP